MTATKKYANSPGTNMAQLNPMIAAQRFSGSPQNFSVPIAGSMHPSEEEMLPFPEPEISSTSLDHKPGAKLHYTYYPASPSPKNHPNAFSQTLIVYLNGLLMPRSSWDASIQSFLEKRIVARLPYPGLLSYDRYGQGDSDHDPMDKDPPPCYGHDAMSVVTDLKQLILQIWKDHLDQAKPTHFPTLIFVCNSIGCGVARLFAQQYPGTVSGLLFLDSMMVNSNYQDFWPDPDAPDFNPHTLPEGVTADEVRETRKAYRRLFYPDVKNQEGFDRRNLAKLLPDSDAPMLRGYLDKGPYLTVVGHDWETFAEQSFVGPLKTPKVLTMTYANPAWRRFNEGLARLTDAYRSIGPIVALGCGHFIQRDGPGFVSDELVSLLDRVVNRVEQVSQRS
ncbi:Alpha/Beta hydrolase protein [Phaeosphaeriaceae sp. PMI808]|nr:Alpha/Beta hydrolase protein [Phaeosphaeriaceae sp. PMI808]